jgi:hypothetical protein
MRTRMLHCCTPRRWLWHAVLGTLLFLSGAPAPSAAQVIVRGALAYETTAAPGSTYANTIVLYNEGDSSRTAAVSLRDYTFSADGTTRYDDPGTLARSNAPWIDYGGSTVTLPPEQEVEVTYQVDVPAQMDGEPPTGTYWSMLLVEPLNQPQGAAAQGIAVQQVRRYGIQVATHIRETGTPELSLLSTDLQRATGGAVLSLSVENAGTRGVRPAARVELYDASGALVLQQEASRKRIYPGTSVRYRLDLAEAEAGTYQALLVVRADAGRPIGRQFTVEL